VAVGRWVLLDGKLTAQVSAHATSRNILYSFVSDDAVLYIGKSILPLKTRLQGYRTPGPTQSTNIRSNKRIRDLLERDKVVEIYALPDNGLLHYGGFHVNLAAGLEDSLIRDLAPPWNGGKTETIEVPRDMAP